MPKALPRVTGTAPTTTCNAKTRSGRLCRLSSGHRTPHPGQGRCFLHGGLTPIRNGRYSVIKRDSLRDMISHYEADPDPLNVLPELAAARALFQDFVERYDTWAAALVAWHESFRSENAEREPKPVQVLDISDAYRIVAEITRIVERIEKVRAANAITRADMLRVMTEMGRVVEAFVQDEAARTKIREGWLSIRVA